MAVTMTLTLTLVTVMVMTVMMMVGAQRSPVDPGLVLALGEQCAGHPDGTVCTKRCVDITCDPRMARCYQVTPGECLQILQVDVCVKGRCKRSGQHPCEVDPWHMKVHPCCCGDCNNIKVDI